MSENLLVQADSWGFVCECATEGKWQIYPANARENWKLQQVESRWLLIIKDVPQVSFLEVEAQGFLKRRKSYFPRNETLRRQGIKDRKLPESSLLKNEDLLGSVKYQSTMYYN